MSGLARLKNTALTLQEQRQERHKEHQEDGYNATSDPVKDRAEVVAAILTNGDVPTGVGRADGELLVESTEVQHYDKSATIGIPLQHDTYA